MADRFDHFTRIAGSGLPRREALRLIAGGLAAAALAHLFPRAAWGEEGCTPFQPCPPGGCATHNSLTCETRNTIRTCTYSCQDAVCTGKPVDNVCPQELPVCVVIDRGPECVECERASDCKKQKSQVCCNNQCCPKDQTKCCGDRCCPEDKECCGRECCTKGKCCNGVCCDDACHQCKDGQCVQAHCTDEKKPVCCLKKDGSGHYCCTKDQCCGLDTDDCMAKTGMKESRIDAVTAAGKAVQMHVTVRDHRGIGTIVTTRHDNATVRIAPFREGETEVGVTATKIDPQARAVVQLLVCPPAACGCLECCGVVDPVIAELRVFPGRSRVKESFAGIPSSEHVLSVQNGSPGLRLLHVNVNGRWAGLLPLGAAQIRTADLAPFLLAEQNIVTLTGEGTPGSHALVLIGDLPAAGSAEKSPAVPPPVRWETGPGRPDVDLHWGM